MNAWRRETGFTLVELLVVVIILAILAAIAVPHLVPASDDAKRATLEQDEAILNKAIELYHLQHGGTFPGVRASKQSWAIFVEQMTGQTNEGGRRAPVTGPICAPASRPIRSPARAAESWGCPCWRMRRPVGSMI